MSVEDKLSSFDERGERMQELKQSPMYGFKAQLVRLIGNLCFRNKINQDKVSHSLNKIIIHSIYLSDPRYGGSAFANEL